MTDLQSLKEQRARIDDQIWAIVQENKKALPQSVWIKKSEHGYSCWDGHPPAEGYQEYRKVENDV